MNVTMKEQLETKMHHLDSELEEIKKNLNKDTDSWPIDIQQSFALVDRVKVQLKEGLKDLDGLDLEKFPNVLKDYKKNWNELMKAYESMRYRVEQRLQ